MQTPDHFKNFLEKHKFKLEENSPLECYKNESLTATVNYIDGKHALNIYVTKNPEIFIFISINDKIGTEILSAMISKLFIQN